MMKLSKYVLLLTQLAVAETLCEASDDCDETELAVKPAILLEQASYPYRNLEHEDSEMWDLVQKPYFLRQMDLIKSGLKGAVDEELPMTKLNYHREHKSPLVGTYDIEDDAYALTRSGLDLFSRGFFRGFSADPVNCHSCFTYYDYMYYTVAALEQVYAEWIQPGLGMEGSYQIFLQITKVYEYFDIVNEGCDVKGIMKAIWDKLLQRQVRLVVGDIGILINNMFIMWYGIAWNNYEDCGLAAGIWTKTLFKMDMDEFDTENVRNWECPDENQIERATYNDWIIGYW